MHKTKAAEQYQVNGANKNAILYTKVEDVFFRMKDKMIVVYVEKGFIETLPDETSGEDVDHFRKISNKAIPFTQDAMKALLDGEAVNFNSDGSNNIIAAMESGSNAILKKFITDKPEEFFGHDVAKWEQV